MSARYDAVVVGAGATGIACARHLARLGARRVCLLEARELGHDRGSSHGPSRIIRLAYDRPEYVSLVREAFLEWAELERATGDAVYIRTGEVFFGPPDGPLAGYATALDLAGVPTERLDPDGVARRYPAVRLPRGTAALYHPDGGILAAARILAIQLALARAAGVEVVVGSPVLAIDRDGTDPVVVTAHARLTARRVVVAAGAWTARFVPELAGALRPVVQRVVYLEPARDATAFGPDRFPVWVSLDREMHYGLPTYDAPGVKIAMHDQGGAAFDPDDGDRSVSADRVEALRAFAARHFPGLADARAVGAHACLYTMTPGESLHAGPLAHDPRILVSAACSGHAFKFTALLGRILAELALGLEPSSATYCAHRRGFALP